jgi:hypothetical protein
MSTLSRWRWTMSASDPAATDIIDVIDQLTAPMPEPPPVCASCGEPLPADGPSADFCGELCQNRWAHEIARPDDAPDSFVDSVRARTARVPSVMLDHPWRAHFSSELPPGFDLGITNADFMANLNAGMPREYYIEFHHTTPMFRAVLRSDGLWDITDPTE